MDKKNMTLLVMAAGMGSRFGGLKQIEPFGPNGEFLTDYSIYDAIKAGFNKVVFIIKEENLKDFQDTIGKRIEKIIPVEYAFQKLESIPANVEIPKERVKPWGTAHAILCAKDKIDEDFVVINADDFYGRDAFEVASSFINSKEYIYNMEYGIVGYKVKNTLTENGSVKRGVCKTEGNLLVDIIESSVKQEDNGIFASPLDGSDSFEVKEDSYVSMNMLILNPTIFKYIEDNMKEFFENNKDKLESCEFLIPDILKKSIFENLSTITILPTDAQWIGVTYKEDTDGVKSSLSKMIDDGIYPEKLWEN